MAWDILKNHLFCGRKQVLSQRLKPGSWKRASNHDSTQMWPSCSGTPRQLVSQRCIPIPPLFDIQLIISEEPPFLAMAAASRQHLSSIITLYTLVSNSCFLGGRASRQPSWSLDSPAGISEGHCEPTSLPLPLTLPLSSWLMNEWAAAFPWPVGSPLSPAMGTHHHQRAGVPRSLNELWVVRQTLGLALEASAQNIELNHLRLLQETGCANLSSPSLLMHIH